MKKIYYLILTLILLTACSGRLEAASLKVSPAGFIIHNIVPGRTYDVYKESGLQLTIYNDSAADKTYLLSAHRPSEGGTWEKGYLEIPDPKWCWFDRNEIKVEANSKAYVRFHLKVPDEERYYNQHWVVTLNIAGKPGPGGGVGVAINVRAQIETQSRAALKSVTPDGLIGVVPSVITLKTKENREVVIFNNSATNETYKIYPLTDKEKFQKYISAGFSPLPEPDWLKLGDGSITIPAGGRKTLSLKVSLPEKEKKKYESIIFIEGQSATGFMRVQFMGTDDKTEVMRQETK
ncbi:MAG: hypothetical protein A2283_04410 [Lentisphaerae bacterium RIFOXYA12_FULL_48_11]|nr:MAG: hypothetical protein A2283_04410 [Lentisphaerae bacterium RIFOXYA12_FULL_48_11]